MSAQASPAAAARSSRFTALWAALVAALSAAAWLVWLSWADDEPTLAAWQVLGVIASLLCAVGVGVPRVGALRAWVLTVVPFAAFGAYSLIGSDPLGAIGAVVWVGLVVVGVGAVVGLVVGVRAVVTSRRQGRSRA